MAVKKVITIADKRLYQPSEAITKFDSQLRTLVRDMFDSMYAERGVGLAAVQIGILKRVLVIDLVEQGFIKGVFVNPFVMETSKEIQDGEEGCLSVPGLSAKLIRPKWVKIGYQDISGNQLTAEGSDLLARAFLHEMDHLDGKVFVDQLEPEIHAMLSGDIDKISRGEKIEKPVTPAYRKERMKVG